MRGASGRPSRRGRFLPAEVGSALLLSLAGAGGAQEAAPSAADESRAVAAHAIEVAEGLSRAGRLAEARRLLERALREEPASRAGLEALADVLSALGRPQDLVPWAERAVEAAPDEPAHRRTWIRGLLGAGRADSARAVARRWVAKSPGEPAAHLELARVETAAGRLPEAIDALDAVASDPESGSAPEVHRARALLALWDGRPSEAIDHLRLAVAERGPIPEERTRWIATLGALEAADSAEAAVVGRALGALFRDADALGAGELMDRLSAVPAGRGRASLLSLAAEGFDRAARPHEASEVRRRLVEGHAEAPERPAAMLELGRRLMERDPAGARAWLERLIVEHPESAVSPVARGLLAELQASTGAR